MIRKRIFVAALSASAVAASGLLLWKSAHAKAPCSALTQPDRARLSEYVQEKYRLPANGFSLASASFVGDTCFQKLEFKTAARPSPLSLYLSPDHRFLSRDLVDYRAQADSGARRNDPALVSGLMNGPFPVSGPENAPVTLTVFSDFQCPFCGRMHGTLKNSVLPAAGAKVRVVFRYLPLPMHPWARAAAEQAECAHQQKNEYFWSLYDYIFEHQSELNSGNLREKVAAVTKGLPGFDQARFNSCIDGKKSAARIDEDVAFANKIDVSATPTLFVNTQRVEGAGSPEEILTLIREAGQPVTKVAEALHR